MTAPTVLLLAALVTWALRVSFIALVPAARLPARVHRALDDVAPAVMAAIVVTHLAHGEGFGGLVPSDLAAAGAAAVVAWRTGHLAGTVLTGVVAAGLLRLM